MSDLGLVSPNDTLTQTDDDLLLKRLRIFLVVVDEMSISAAARRLDVSQPAISQQIKAVETMLAARLFNRVGRELRLTDAGRSTVRVARELVGQVDIAVSGLREGARLQHTTLRLGFSAPHLALPAARTFKERYPKAILQLSMGNSSNLFKKLDDYELDAVFVGIELPPERYHSVLYLRQPLVAICARSHPWSNRERVSLEELCAQPLIIRERGSYTRKVFFDAAAARGLVPKIGFEIFSREATSEAAAQGLGINTVLDSERLNDQRIHRIEIEDNSILGHEYLVCRKEFATMPPISLLISTLPFVPLPRQWQN